MRRHRSELQRCGRRGLRRRRRRLLRRGHGRASARRRCARTAAATATTATRASPRRPRSLRRRRQRLQRPIDEGCDDDGDGYCDSGRAVVSNLVCPRTGGGPECTQDGDGAVVRRATVVLDTHSHGGGFSPFYDEYWYPQWDGHDGLSLRPGLRSRSGRSRPECRHMMQLWGDTDGTFYTANWGERTASRRAWDSRHTVLWTTNIGTTAGGVTADESFVYAMGADGSTVWQLDKADGHIVETFALDGLCSGCGMNGGLAVAGGKLFRGDACAQVYRYDLASRQWEGAFNTPVAINNMSFNGRDYCVSANDSNAVLLRDRPGRPARRATTATTRTRASTRERRRRATTSTRTATARSTTAATTTRTAGATWTLEIDRDAVGVRERRRRLRRRRTRASSRTARPRRATAWTRTATV